MICVDCVHALKREYLRVGDDQDGRVIMGMFDTVHVPCPRCNSSEEIQTKFGDCALADYSLNNAPPVILGGLDGEEKTCNKCGLRFKVNVIAYAKTIPLRDTRE